MPKLIRVGVDARITRDNDNTLTLHVELTRDQVGYIIYGAVLPHFKGASVQTDSLSDIFTSTTQLTRIPEEGLKFAITITSAKEKYFPYIDSIGICVYVPKNYFYYFKSPAYPTFNMKIFDTISEKITCGGIPIYRKPYIGISDHDEVFESGLSLLANNGGCYNIKLWTKGNIAARKGDFLIAVQTKLPNEKVKLQCMTINGMQTVMNGRTNDECIWYLHQPFPVLLMVFYSIGDITIKAKSTGDNDIKLLYENTDHRTKEKIMQSPYQISCEHIPKTLRFTSGLLEIIENKKI